MSRSRRTLIYLLVLALLVPALLVSHAELARAHFVHSVAGDLAVSHDCESEFSISTVGIADISDENTCHHKVEVGCGSGDCCYPVPASRANYGEKKGLGDHSDIVSPALLGKRLEPPPPRNS